MDFTKENPNHWVLTIYDGEDNIKSQEVIPYEDEGTAENMAYNITMGTVEYDEDWDWSMMSVQWWIDNS